MWTAQLFGIIQETKERTLFKLYCAQRLKASVCSVGLRVVPCSLMCYNLCHSQSQMLKGRPTTLYDTGAPALNQSTQTVHWLLYVSSSFGADQRKRSPSIQLIFWSLQFAHPHLHCPTVSRPCNPNVSLVACMLVPHAFLTLLASWPTVLTAKKHSATRFRHWDRHSRELSHCAQHGSHLRNDWVCNGESVAVALGLVCLPVVFFPVLGFLNVCVW